MTLSLTRTAVPAEVRLAFLFWMGALAAVPLMFLPKAGGYFRRTER